MKSGLVWAGEVLVWAALLVGVWVVTLNSVATSEMASAAGSGVVCGVVAAAARRAVEGRWRPSVAWLRWVAVLPVAVVADTGLVLAAAAGQVLRPRASRGRLTEVGLGADGDDRRAAARSAVATIAVSATPASFVVDADPDRRTLLVHTLVSGRPSMPEVVEG